jgi:hypothetical protein
MGSSLFAGAFLKRATYLPDDEVVVVLATEGSQVLLVLGEAKRLDVDLVELEAVNDLESVEVPDDNVSLKTVCISI